MRSGRSSSPSTKCLTSLAFLCSDPIPIPTSGLDSVYLTDHVSPLRLLYLSCAIFASASRTCTVHCGQDGVHIEHVSARPHVLSELTTDYEVAGPPVSARDVSHVPTLPFCRSHPRLPLFSRSCPNSVSCSIHPQALFLTSHPHRNPVFGRSAFADGLLSRGSLRREQPASSVSKRSSDVRRYV